MQDFLVGAERLRQLAGEHNLPLAIYSGCEVFMDWDLLDIIAENGSFCLNGDAWDAARASYILVELPMYFIPNYADDFWYELRLKGVVPILAHPERYTELMAKPDLLLRWRREGLLLQCNIGSFAGSFGAQAEQAAKLLLANGLVDFVGSDAHRDSGRDTDMRAGAAVIRELAGEAVLQQLTQINPQRIIDGTPLKVKAPQQLIAKEKKSKWWNMLFK
ncbi:tyrosine-protein phosphatase [Phascolarctobacterium succinatutens]